MLLSILGRLTPSPARTTGSTLLFFFSHAGRADVEDGVDCADAPESARFPGDCFICEADPWLAFILARSATRCRATARSLSDRARMSLSLPLPLPSLTTAGSSCAGLEEQRTLTPALALHELL